MAVAQLEALSAVILLRETLRSQKQATYVSLRLYISTSKSAEKQENRDLNWKYKNNSNLTFREDEVWPHEVTAPSFYFFFYMK